MAMHYTQILKKTARDCLVAPADPDIWSAIGKGFFAALALIVRVVALLTFPLFVPILAYLAMLAERKYEKQVVESIKRTEEHYGKLVRKAPPAAIKESKIIDTKD